MTAQHLKRRISGLVFALSLVALAATNALAQAGSLRGHVTDPNGATVAGARVGVHGPSGLVRTTTTDADGAYSFSNLPPGDYTVEASAPSLVLPQSAKITLRSGSQTLDLQLTVFIP